jgi:DNA repair exonuclease SbcCD ATPase subunit
MTDLVQTRHALDDAIAAQREAAHLQDLLARLRRELAVARESLARLRARHESEAQDVERLEGFGLTAVLAAVRGTRTGSLDRERAEEVAARYAMQTATARLQALEGRREEVDRRLARLGDTAARREAAVQAHVEALRAGASPHAAGLEAVLDELAEAGAEATELDQAHEAGIRAAAALDAALGELSSADSWSAYDTWFGGGLVSSAIKHNRLDDAGRLIARAQEALLDLARELQDVEKVTDLRADLGISPTTRAFDVWFDNVVSDLSVRSSIKDSQARVQDAAASVREAMQRLVVRRATLDQRVADLRARRDALLGG